MSISALGGLSLAIVLLLALHLRLSGLPGTLLAVARKDRVQDGGRLLDAMKEAVAARSGQAVIAVTTLQDQLAQSLRAQLAEAEMRARVAERRAADTVTALEAASTLVRELRESLESVSEVARSLHAIQQRPAPVPPPSSPRPAPPSSVKKREAARSPGLDEDTERKTAEMPSGPVITVGPAVPVVFDDDGGFDDENEQTKVADKTGAFAALRKGPQAAQSSGPAEPALNRRALRSTTVLPPPPGGLR